MDREKVIKKAEHIMRSTVDRDMIDSFCKDVIALLKEQETVEPRRIDGKRNHFIKCGNCNYDLTTGYLFCPHCGRSVKWE